MKTFKRTIGILLIIWSLLMMLTFFATYILSPGISAPQLAANAAAHLVSVICPYVIYRVIADF